MTEGFANRYQTTLASGVTSGALTGTVVSVTGVPAVPFRAILSAEGANTDEIVLVTGVAGSVLTWTRAAEAVAGVQAASAHASGATFTAIVTAVQATRWEEAQNLYDPGIVRTSDSIPGGAASTGLTMSNANQAAFARWRGSGAITKVGIEVIVSSGNICAAIYSPSGTGRDAVPGVRKATTGAIACPASGYRELDLGGSVAIEAGDWFGFSADNTNAFFLMTEDAGNGLVTNLLKGLRYYRGVFTLPDPASPEAAALLRIPFAIGVP